MANEKATMWKEKVGRMSPVLKSEKARIGIRAGGLNAVPYACLLSFNRQDGVIPPGEIRSFSWSGQAEVP